MWELWTGGKTPYPTFSNPQVLDEVTGCYIDEGSLRTLFCTSGFKRISIGQTFVLSTRSIRTDEEMLGRRKFGLKHSTSLYGNQQLLLLCAFIRIPSIAIYKILEISKI